MLHLTQRDAIQNNLDLKDDLYALMDKNDIEKPAKEDREALREFLVAHPDLWTYAAQTRYIRAVEALAWIRKLQLPPIQVNIAEQQVNQVNTGNPHVGNTCNIKLARFCIDVRDDERIPQAARCNHCSYAALQHGGDCTLVMAGPLPGGLVNKAQILAAAIYPDPEPAAIPDRALVRI